MLKRLKRWFKNVKKAALPQFEPVAKTITSTLYGIVNYFKLKILQACGRLA